MCLKKTLLGVLRKLAKEGLSTIAEESKDYRFTSGKKDQAVPE